MDLYTSYEWLLHDFVRPVLDTLRVEVELSTLGEIPTPTCEKEYDVHGMLTTVRTPDGTLKFVREAVLTPGMERPRISWKPIILEPPRVALLVVDERGNPVLRMHPAMPGAERPIVWGCTCELPESEDTDQGPAFSGLIHNHAAHVVNVRMTHVPHWPKTRLIVAAVARGSMDRYLEEHPTDRRVVALATPEALREVVIAGDATPSLLLTTALLPLDPRALRLLLESFGERMTAPPLPQAEG